MTSETRRDFLKFAGATAALSMLPPSIRAALTTPAASVTGTIQDVQHVVILMQENRSFDHYFGALRGVRGFDDPRPLSLPNGKTVWNQPKTSTKNVLPFRLSTETTAAQCLADIDHSWKGSHTLWKDYNVWVKTKGDMCMGHFTRTDLPFYYALADAFTVCDAYYCSIFGPTNPNRLHLFSGTSGLAVGNTGTQTVNNADDGNWTADMSKDSPTFTGLGWKTYAERLQAAGVNWRVYQEYDNYGDNLLQSFAAFRKLDTASENYKRGRAWVPGSTSANASASRGEYLIAEFAKDVRNDTLPQVSWIVPPYIMSEHPAATPAYGESLTARLLEALVANPAVWAKTVFIINYDENGGFFDHIPAPLPAISSSLGKSTVDTSAENYNGVPVGLGVRVPMLVVSPWSKGGWVNSQVFDHTSVLRFLEARFGIAESNIGPWRRAVTGDLSTAFDFVNPNAAWPTLPDTSSNITSADQTCQLRTPTAPNKPAMPRQEHGSRPARALPYTLHVHGRVEASSGRYWLDFANEGVAGAGFNIYSRNRTDGPWFYTLTPGTQLSDYWSAAQVTAGKYDLSAFGPNGFLRVFQGDLLKAAAPGGANPEVQASYDLINDQLTLRFTNSGTGACTLTLRPNFYSSASARTYALAAGATVTDIWPLAASSYWYDLSITSSSDTGYLRRLAGHVETGAPSVSDPAIGAG
ncbi:MAG TPA: phospholipase C, phosphocholine-specific [Lysobacter sp.]|nr:phospholipase C, phosphocholine-specific [Lysobacter sp.]